VAVTTTSGTHRLLDARAREHRLGGAGRGDDDVGGAEDGGEGRPRDRLSAELCRERLRAGERTAGDRDLLHLLGLQVDARQLRHLAGAEDEHVQSLEVAEDLPRQGDCGVAHRHGAFAEPGLAAHAFAHGERGVEQAVRERAGMFDARRGGKGVFHLSQDLRLADDERIQSGGNTEQVPRGFAAAQHEYVGGHAVPGQGVVLGDEARADVGGGVAVRRGVNLRAVAGGHDHRLARHLAVDERLERRVEPRAREIDGFPQLDRRGPMADADRHELHQKLWLLVRK
jgi:hypothetical protein